MINYKIIIINFLTLLVISLSLIVGLYYQSDKVISPQIMDYFLEALSIALSEIKYGFDGYTGFETIRETLNQTDFAHYSI